MSLGGIETEFLEELREDISGMFEDTCNIYTPLGAGASSNGRGGVTKDSGGRVNGLLLQEEDVPCRIQSTRMRIGIGEAEVGNSTVGKDEGILVLPYDKVLSNGCIVEVTTRDGFVSRFEISQQMEQTSALTRVFGVQRIK